MRSLCAVVQRGAARTEASARSAAPWLICPLCRAGLRCGTESARQSLRFPLWGQRGGKSGLLRTRCQVTPGGREPTESATERYRRCAGLPQGRLTQGKGEMVR